MKGAAPQLEVYLEVGDRCTFAVAMGWPGWARAGREPQAALQALLEAGPRYQGLLARSELEFEPVAAVRDFEVVAELEGDSTTDFGAPGLVPEQDRGPLTAEELPRLTAILDACWDGLEQAVERAQGRELRKGPRGGGRELDAIVEHVLGAQVSYLSRIGRKPDLDEELAFVEQCERMAMLVKAGLAAGVRAELPPEGPRGGVRWPARYFARRCAWHIVDHAWEIEDRLD